ncbi:MAG: lipoate--protein ligase family protein [Candidatus Latescibacteria bacterium]|nr:lipoate--protein ligase family protein [Candidatus Latescibacterota bacterium]
MSTWRFLDTGPASGALNMAVDEALLEGAAQGEPVLRIFGWEPPALSFGYGQQPWREVDLDKCRAAGVEVVRRLTGGRAVLHWEELTYSVVCREDDPQCGGPISHTYRRIGEALVEGLKLFGVEAILERARPRALRPRERGVSEPCFSSLARWEVKCGGRKLIGSAQRRVRGAVLQHGSLLIGPQHRRLLELLPAGRGEGRGEAARHLEEGSICLRECVDGPVDLARLGQCLAEGFGRCLEVEMRPGGLSPAEEERAAELMELQYGNPAWTGAVRNLSLSHG